MVVEVRSQERKLESVGFNLVWGGLFWGERGAGILGFGFFLGGVLVKLPLSTSISTVVLQRKMLCIFLFDDSMEEMVISLQWQDLGFCS